MKTIRYEFKTNEEWRKERANSIGASSIGIIMGANAHSTPMDLAERMRAERDGVFSYDENEYMLNGHAYEPGIAYKFSKKTGHAIIQSSAKEYLLRREDIPFMHASPDRTYWIDEEGLKHGKNAEANKGILECKTNWSSKMPLTEIPLSWEFQLQVQMGIGGYKEGYLAWERFACPDKTQSFGYRRYEFDEEVFNAAVEVCRDFWERCIIGGEEPDPIAPCDILRRYPTSVEGKTITADEDILTIINTIKDQQAAAKEIEASIQEMKDALVMQFSDEESIVSPLTGKALATYKTKAGSMRVDSKRLKADYPEVYAEVASKGADTRVLLIK